MSKFAIKILWNCDFITIWPWELWQFAGLWWRGRTLITMMSTMVVKMWLAAARYSLVQPVAVGAAHISKVWMGVGFGGEGLLATASCRQQLTLLGVPPFHPTVLEPDLDLHRDKENFEYSWPTCNYWHGSQLVWGYNNPKKPRLTLEQ